MENVTLDAGTGGAWHPFSRANALQDAHRGIRHVRTPTLAMVVAAYVADDLDYEDLERLIEAALTGSKTEIPEPMLSRFFPPTMNDALKEQWTSPRMRVPATDKPGGILYYRP